MKTRVLIVEDHPFQRQVTEEYLSGQGFEVASVATAAAFRTAVPELLPQVVVLDVGLPDEDGFALARWLRSVDEGVGILMLTAANELLDRVLGLESGADDYLTKPYEPRELLARIRALARRAAPGRVAASAHADRIAVGDAMLDPKRRSLIQPDGREEPLTEAEFSLLQTLLLHPNRPLHRDWLLETTAAEGASDANERAIDLRVMRLRRKLEADPDNPLLIRSVRGVGYVYVPRS